MGCPLVKAAFFLVLTNLCYSTLAEGDVFKDELFLDKDDLNSGLYEGQIKGRKLFGKSQYPHGNGTIYYFSNDKFQRINYTGQWFNGTRHGFGNTYFKDGSYYSGQYENGVEEGEGSIYYSNGNVLTGDFREGKIHGNAVFKYPNGDQREGFFHGNILDGQVIYTRADGRTVIEYWKNGAKVQDQDQWVPEVTSQDSGPVVSDTNSELLTRLRSSIRSGDRSSAFIFGGPPSILDHNRQPKLDEGDESIYKLARQESERKNKDFLKSLFQVVVS